MKIRVNGKLATRDRCMRELIKFLDSIPVEKDPQAFTSNELAKRAGVSVASVQSRLGKRFGSIGLPGDVSEDYVRFILQKAISRISKRTWPMPRLSKVESGEEAGAGAKAESKSI